MNIELNDIKANLVMIEGLGVRSLFLWNDFDFFKNTVGFNKVIWLLPRRNQCNGQVKSWFENFEFMKFHPIINGVEKTCWVSPIGLIILEDEDSPALKFRDISETHGWNVPTTEWLIEVLRSGRYFSKVSESYLTKLEWNTPEAIAKREKEIELLKKAKDDKILGILKKFEKPSSQENRDLIEEVLLFDVYYDYSDDHAYCIMYRQYERDLRAKLKSMGMEAALDDSIKSVVDRKPSS